jgi:membrane peptidoglycan carboxypeptidase
VVRAVIRDGRRTEIGPKVLQQAIGPSTAATLTGIMEGVVERGTARSARIPGYAIAGKTGTAAKLNPSGGYSSTDYNASFVGFLPSRNPRFTILVVVDTPRTGGYYGGVVAAPIFKKIAEAAVQLAGLPPAADGPLPLLARPAPRDLPSRRPILPASPTLVLAGGPGAMPDLTGLPAREAVRIMTKIGLTVRVAGSGFVVRQSPAAGAPVDAGGRGTVELRRTLSTRVTEDEP